MKGKSTLTLLLAGIFSCGTCQATGAEVTSESVFNILNSTGAATDKSYLSLNPDKYPNYRLLIHSAKLKNEIKSHYTKDEIQGLLTLTENTRKLTLTEKPWGTFILASTFEDDKTAAETHYDAVWLGISIMVFSFNFSPIVSSFVVSKREEYEKDFGRDFTERKCSQIISRASMLMVAVVMFFAFSCLFTLSPANMAEAKAQNIPVLSYLANHFASMTGTKTTFAITLEYAASIIALVAIFKSFFGHYLGTLEGLNGLILKFGYKGDKTKVSLGKLNTLSMIFIMGSTWVVAYANPNILDLIEAMGAPIIASLLCLLPMYAIRKAPSLAKYRGRLDNVFVTVIGLLTILNIVYKLF
ncbi:TPA: hypothetical protein ACF5BX_004230 [Escherichia coli]